MSNLCVNLWDDYADDGDLLGVETHARVEGDAAPERVQELLGAFAEHLSQWCLQHGQEVSAAVVLHEPLKLYPHMADKPEFADFYRPQWQVEIRGLRHREREAYVEYTQSHPLVVSGSTLAVISES